MLAWENFKGEEKYFVDFLNFLLNDYIKEIETKILVTKEVIRFCFRSKRFFELNDLKRFFREKI